jgi:outer membrane protein TolC
MNKMFTRFLFPIVLLASCSLSYGQNVFSLEDIIARSKAQSPASKQAETRKENRYWSYRLYKSNYNPQLSANGNLPSYENSVNLVQQPDGTYLYLPVEQSVNDASLALSQPLWWTGGTISANTELRYYQNFRTVSPGQMSSVWSGRFLDVALNQPLFAYNPLRWDRKTQPLLYEESRREYVEQMEFISREAVNRFFNVLQAQISLQIAQFNLANNDTIYKIEQGRFNIGTTSQDKLLQVELQLLRSRQAVAQSTLDLETARLQLRSFIGLRNGEDFQLIAPAVIPAFEVNLEEALQSGKQNRSAFIAFERRRLEAAEEVAVARGQRFRVGVTAAYGLTSNGVGQVNDVYKNPDEFQQFFLSFNVPILDWGRGRARVQQALANKKLVNYTIAQEEVDFEQAIITQVRQFEMLRLQIQITQKSDEVASERYNVAQNRYLIGKIDVTNLNIALTEKDDAKQAYVLALKQFWTAYYDLRRLTLYDFHTKNLLYNPEL